MTRMTVLAIGSKNKAKITALKNCVEKANLFDQFEILSLSVSSEVSDQPLTLDETTQGAKNRAYNAYHQCSTMPDFSFGIESGLMETPNAHSGHLHISICAIYDGQQFYLGSSTGFEIPHEILKKIFDENLDLSQACLASKISTNQNLGEEEGLIGILTQGRVNRLEYSMQCIDSALIQIMNPSWYCLTPSKKD